MSILAEQVSYSVTLRDENYKSFNGTGSMELNKIENNIYKIRIIKTIHTKNKNILYELLLGFEYKRALVGLKNLFRKNKIKTNKDENMFLFYNTIKNLIEKMEYDPFEFKYLLEQINQGYGIEIKPVLLRTDLNSNIVFSRTKTKHFKSLNKLIAFLKDENKIF